jgi:hypothetical protein
MGLGAAEGVFLTLLVCWALAALAPVTPMASRALEARGERHPLAEAVGRLAHGAQQGLVGRAAAAANPLSRATPVRLAVELAQTATDERALERFVQDPAMETLFDEPEVKRAVDRLSEDTEIRDLVEKRDLEGLLDNETIFEIASDRRLRRLVLAHRDEILAALKRARRAPAAQPQSLLPTWHRQAGRAVLLTA